MMAALFALSSAAAGLAQAELLARAAGKPPHPLAFAARLLLVGLLLVLAARAGQLLWGATGWALGFGMAAVAAYRRLR